MKSKLIMLSLLLSVGCYSFAIESASSKSAPPNVSLSVADVEAAPVPWVPGDDVASNGNLSDGILFKSLPQEAEIAIYTVSGNLVKKILVESNVGQSYYAWNGKNEEGEDAASGVYVWVAKSEEGKKTGKIVVVR